MYHEPDNTTVAFARHAQYPNGDECHVLVWSLDDSQWLAAAVDVAESYEPLDAEVIAACATEAEAVDRAETWLDDNPKGVAGDGGDGMLTSLFGGGA